MELMKAARQWSQRPDDERFESLESLYQDRVALQNASKEVRFQSGQIVADDGEVYLQGVNARARLTNHSFGQLCGRAGAPAGYLRALPAALAAECLQSSLATTGDNPDKVLIHRGDDTALTVRAVTSEKYSRVWDREIVGRLITLQEDGWRVPTARPVRPGQKGTRKATKADVLNSAHGMLGIREGDDIAPAGLYASDRDMFAFMVDDSRRISTPSGDLFRGFFLWNSEVGATSLGIMTFLFDAVCGNHIVWGASDVREIRIRHVGNALDRGNSAIRMQLLEYSNASATEEEQRISRAAERVIAAKKEDVVALLFGKKLPGLTKAVLTSAYEAVERDPRYGNPGSVWGMVCGLTEVAQDTAYTDQRNLIDVSAGRLLDMPF